MQSPTDAPRIPASASGVSMQRSAPKRSHRPAVARNTPPERPTSSPSTRTESSRSSSTCKASLIASIISRSANVASENPPQLGEVVLQGRGRVRIRVLEQERDVRVGLGFGLGDPRAHHLERVLLDRCIEVVVEDSVPPQVAVVAAEAFVLLLLLDALRSEEHTSELQSRVDR